MLPVKTLDFERKLLVSGTVSAWDPVQVGSEANGLKVEAVLVDEGAHLCTVVKSWPGSTAVFCVLSWLNRKLALPLRSAGLVKAIQPNRP